jgi:hypothetical protein
LSRKTALACLLALSALYCVVEMVPGRFAVTDEVYFKAAGRNWATTGKFAAPEMKGLDSIDPPLADVFFAYPPIYPFLFGIYTKAVGFGPRSCILYDLLIHLSLVWCGALVARLVHGVPWTASVLCGALLLPAGTVGRPDELGIVWALGAALALRSEVPLKFAIPLGGVLLGLCCATSLGACLFLGSLVGWEVTLRERSHPKKLRNLMITALIAIIVVAICVAPILVSHPLAYRQLVLIGGSQTSLGNAGGGHPGFAKTFLDKWSEALRQGYDKVILVAGGLIFGLLCWKSEKDPEIAEYSRFILIFISLLLLLFFMPGKYTYLWFAGSWLLIACVALGWKISRVSPPSRWRPLLAFGIFLWVVISLPYLRSKLILWTLPVDQSLTFNVNRTQEEIPEGAGVLTTEYWWALAGRNPVYDTLFSNPGPDAFDYAVLTGNGSGRAGVPLAPEVALGGSEWQRSEDHLRSTPPTVLGIRLSRSAYGFGPYILKKNK